MDNLTYMMTNPELERETDGYEHLLDGIRKSFRDTECGNVPLFTTDVEDLYDIFLKQLPKEAQQHYTCNACRNFVNRYGNLVHIDDDGEITPVMWDFIAPEFFEEAVSACYMAVKHAKITGVFVTSEKRLGMPKTGVWTHMAVDIPRQRIYRNRLKTAYQEEAEKREDFKMLLAACKKYRVETVQTAVNLLKSDSMYRGEKILGIAEWFLDILNIVKKNNRLTDTHILWKKAATAPSGFCHVSSSMIGTLLDDIEDGYDFEAVRNRFNEKMNPLKYQRPQVAPSAGNIKRAEEIVAKLGIQNSLKRRFARFDEVKKIWIPREKNYTRALAENGVFGAVKAKNESFTPKGLEAPATVMTWDKFQRTVLPMAHKIEIAISQYHTDSYAAFVTAEDMDAPPIIQWDNDEYRNPVNWYLYNGGSTISQWNLKAGWTEVTGITLQPNMWQSGFEHQGHGVLFILDSCKDLHNKSSALFPETLRGELREVRSTIEAYSRMNALSGLNEASACGLLKQSGKNWNVQLRVTTDLGRSLYKLDRWD